MSPLKKAGNPSPLCGPRETVCAAASKRAIYNLRTRSQLNTPFTELVLELFSPTEVSPTFCRRHRKMIDITETITITKGRQTPLTTVMPTRPLTILQVEDTPSDVVLTAHALNT